MTNKKKQKDSVKKLIFFRGNRILLVDEDQFWYDKGCSTGKLGNHEEALKFYDKALKINQNYAEAWYGKGYALVNLGRYKEAINCYDKALKINPDYADALDRKGVALANLGRYEEAIECYDKALKINPNNADIWCDKAVDLESIGKHEEAISCCEKAIKINQKHFLAWYNKGVSLTSLGKHEEAINCYDETIKLNPTFDWSYNNKGVELERLGKHEDAIDCYEKAIKINPNYAEAWYNKGVALSRLGNYLTGIECFDKALEIDPNYAEAWYSKGTALLSTETYEVAIECFDKAIKINTNYADAYGNKGYVLQKMRKFDEAAINFSKAKELFATIGEKEESYISSKYESWASNSAKLISRLDPLDKAFLSSLNCRSLIHLKEKSIKISKGIENVFNEFKNNELPRDLSDLLISKVICFNAPKKALSFEKVNLDKLEFSKKIFEKWGYNTFIIAVNSLINFVISLKNYNGIDEIPQELEKSLLGMLNNTYVLDGILTNKMPETISIEPFDILTSRLEDMQNRIINSIDKRIGKLLTPKKLIIAMIILDVLINVFAALFIDHFSFIHVITISFMFVIVFIFFVLWNQIQTKKEDEL